MATRRNSGADFVRDVGARSGIGHVWAAVLNADGVSYKITLTANGVTTTMFNKVYWPGNSGAITDANPSGDKLIVFSNDDPAVSAEADTQVFLNTLN